MQIKHRILGIIPARAGSKRVPGKNKKILNGKELIRYSIEACLGAKLISTIVVSSDDDDILAIANSYSNVIALKRPDEISNDISPAIDYVKHAIKYMHDNYGESYDLTTIIQPSSPFTQSSDIDNTCQMLIDHMDYADSSVSVMKLDHATHPVKMKTLNPNYELIPYFEEEKGRMAAHELTDVYVRNCSVYVSKIENIKNNKIIGDKCLGYLMPRERSIDINDPIDFDFAEFLMSKQK